MRKNLVLQGTYARAVLGAAHLAGMAPVALGPPGSSAQRELDNEIASDVAKHYTRNPNKGKVLQMLTLYENVTLMFTEHPLFDLRPLMDEGIVEVVLFGSHGKAHRQLYDENWDFYEELYGEDAIQERANSPTRCD